MKKRENLSKVLKQFFLGKNYTPMSLVALFKELKISIKHQKLCVEIIDELISSGFLKLKNKKLFPMKKKQPQNKGHLGVLHLHPKGFGFVTPDDPKLSSQDIFIPKHLTKGAMDRDKVLFSIETKKKSAKGPEGAILSIAERGTKYLVGTILDLSKHDLAEVMVPQLGNEKSVLMKIRGNKTYRSGDRVKMGVEEWGDDEKDLICYDLQLLGHISDPSIDVDVAVIEYDIPTEFPEEVIKEAKKFGKSVKQSEIDGRIDFTNIECFTIDPTTAKDFDDALSLRVDKNGHYHLGVHIADVSHYVKPNSNLDREAIHRCNSTYFPNRCVPMLPEDLSNQLCSLKPDVIRLTASIMMKFDQEGTLYEYEICRGAIKSNKRFTYEEAKEVIEHKKKSPHLPTLEGMVKLCQLLRQKRFDRGSVDLSLPETVLQIDSTGVPTGFVVVEYDITHQLVEEFMLKANEVVAKHFIDQGMPSIFRIHETPLEKNRDDFFAYARTLGFFVPATPTHEDIQKLFENARSTPYSEQLSIAFIRSMKLAAYSHQNVGHYGLALEHYCHFTSPIRRYSDLVVHSLLFGGEIPEDLEKITLECSEKERRSFRAEQSVIKIKKLRYLYQIHQDDPHHVFEATVTKIKPFGIFFNVNPLVMEGFIHISELGNDYFEYQQNNDALVGTRSGKKYLIGDKIHVNLISINLIMLETTWNMSNET